MHDFIHALSYQAGYAFIATRRAPSALSGVMRSFESEPAIAYRASPRRKPARGARTRTGAKSRK